MLNDQRRPASQHAAEHVEDGSGGRLSRGTAGRATAEHRVQHVIEWIGRSGRAAERIILAAAAPLTLTHEALGQIREHDRRQDRQQLLDQPAALAAKIAAESLRDLILVGAEDVADDLLAVIGVHLVKIDSAIDQITGMIAERSGQ